MVLTDDDTLDDNYSDDTEFHTEIFIVTADKEEKFILSTFKPLGAPNPDLQDTANYPKKAWCVICGKDRTQVRCEEHEDAEGCNFCHLKEHQA